MFPFILSLGTPSERIARLMPALATATPLGAVSLIEGVVLVLMYGLVVLQIYSDSPDRQR